jgi:ring-1,2-phenylacetyl-CoA epoxidase subunit PaaE
MSQFYTLKIKDIVRQTDEAVSLSFDVPQDLQPQFRYIQGQYLTLRAEIDGQDVRRSYSICSSPLEPELRVAIKKIEGGLFSTYANERLQKGQSLQVMPPMGRFFVPKENQNQPQNYVFFAAGSGITPILSIIKTLLVSQENSQVTLFYGNKGFHSIIFREELEGLKNKYMSRFGLHHFLSRESPGAPLYKGRLDAQKCAQLSQSILDLSQSDEFYICGPEEMIHSISEFLKQKGVSEDKIHFELFTSPLGKLGAAKPKTRSQSEPEFDCEVSLTLDGYTYDFSLSSSGKNLLDAAQEAGADVPYACKGGVCCTCKAKLLEGEVEMEVNYGLERDEIEAGFILTCQAHPKTKRVVVDFDYHS